MFQPETLRMRALGRLKNLECLDGVNVTDEEMTTALKMAAASRPSSFSILAHARTDQSKPRTLSLVPTAQAILANSQNKPVKLMDDDSQWFQKVTSSRFMFLCYQYVVHWKKKYMLSTVVVFTVTVHSLLWRVYSTMSNLRHRRYLTPVSSVCEPAPRSFLWASYGLNELPEVRFRISFRPDWQIGNGFSSPKWRWFIREHYLVLKKSCSRPRLKK